MRFAIIGSGALGALYGARLHVSGQDVHFLLHSDYPHVQEHGLRIDSPWGNLHLNDIASYQASSDIPPCDVICICLKTTENHLIQELLTPLVSDGCTILLLQNGLSAEQEVSALFPNCLIAGGLCFLCSNKIAPGHIHHLDYGLITLGALHPEHHTTAQHQAIDAQLELIKSHFKAASVPCSIQGEIIGARWRKLLWNIPFNGLCALHNCTTDVIMGEPETRQRALALMKEVQSAAAACGHPIEDAFVEKMVIYTDKMLSYKPSMLLDVLNNRALEIEYMYQRPIQSADEHGMGMVESARLCTQLLEL